MCLGSSLQWLSHSQFPVICYSNTLRIDYPLGMLPPIEQICWLTFVKAHVRGPFVASPINPHSIPFPFPFSLCVRAAKANTNEETRDTGIWPPSLAFTFIQSRGIPTYEPPNPPTPILHIFILAIYCSKMGGMPDWLYMALFPVR